MGRGRDVPERGEASDVGGARISSPLVQSWKGKIGRRGHPGASRGVAHRELHPACGTLGSGAEQLQRGAAQVDGLSVVWQGKWVNKETEPRPVEKRAVARFESEKQWMELAQGTRACMRMFRLGGIYGPGRSALDTIHSRHHSSRQRLREHKRFTSTVHIADICREFRKGKVLDCSPGARVYKVVDDDPSPRAEVMAYARRLLNVEDDDLSSNNELSAVVESSSSNGQVSEKRVSDRRFKAELQDELLHPSFISGLEAIAIASNHPFD